MAAVALVAEAMERGCWTIGSEGGVEAWVLLVSSANRAGSLLLRARSRNVLSAGPVAPDEEPTDESASRTPPSMPIALQDDEVRVRGLPPAPVSCSAREQTATEPAAATSVDVLVHSMNDNWLWTAPRPPGEAERVSEQLL